MTVLQTMRTLFQTSMTLLQTCEAPSWRWESPPLPGEESRAGGDVDECPEMGEAGRDELTVQWVVCGLAPPPEEGGAGKGRSMWDSPTTPDRRLEVAVRKASGRRMSQRRASI